MKRFLVFLIAGTVGLATIVYTGWYRFATTAADDPYDEIFIGLNEYMPQFARNWACDTLYARFEGTLAPHTCTDVWGPDLP